jgi:hypothetical protein
MHIDDFNLLNNRQQHLTVSFVRLFQYVDKVYENIVFFS